MPTQPPAATGAPQQLSPEVESAVNELTSISGQSRENCIRALAMAQNQPDLAFDILLQGVPSEEELQAMQQEADAQQ
jgi:hypothetical protein